MHDTIRYLSLSMLDTHRIKGKLLSKAKSLCDQQGYERLLSQHAISINDAALYIRLYHAWERFQEAERQVFQRSGKTLTTLHEAISLI